MTCINNDDTKLDDIIDNDDLKMDDIIDDDNIKSNDMSMMITRIWIILLTMMTRSWMMTT